MTLKILPALVFASILGTSVSAQSGSVPAPTPFPKTIAVNGSAELQVVPDELFVRVDLKEYKRKGEKRDIEQIRSEFLAHCKAIGIADSNISVLGFSGADATQLLRRQKGKDPELMATLSYQLRFTKAAQMNDLVKELDDEATESFAVTSVGHSKVGEFRRKLRIDAVKAAKEKAIYLCEALNEQVGPAISVEEAAAEVQAETSDFRPLRGNSFKTYANTTYSVGETASVDFRRITYRVNIRVVFAIR